MYLALYNEVVDLKDLKLGPARVLAVNVSVGYSDSP